MFEIEAWGLCMGGNDECYNGRKEEDKLEK